MSSDRSFDGVLREAEENWTAFERDEPAFAAALAAATPQMTDGERALLREIQPWMEYVANSDWFRDRMVRNGSTRAEELRALLREELTRSLPRSGRVGSPRTVGEVMKEARRLAVGVTDEPDFDRLVDVELRKIGWSEATIRDRRARTDAIIEESRLTGRTAPEGHLQDLLFQRIETARMIEIAGEIADERTSRLDLIGDERVRCVEAERRRLTRGLGQRLTEVTGEIAATSALMNHPDLEGLALYQGFEAGIGFDQVWTLLDKDGTDRELLVVEAKGPGAKLRRTVTKGFQMSPEWVVRTAFDMVRGGEANVGPAILNSIAVGSPRLRGFVVVAGRDGAAPTLSLAPGAVPPDGYYPLDELRRVLSEISDP